MNDSNLSTPQPGDPVVATRRWRVSLVWLVPAVAALIGISMMVQTWLSAGPQIRIAFRTATGLEAGKTPVKYKDVTVGSVSAVELSEDGSHVIATVSLAKSAGRLTREDTRFWVVRPRIGVGGISGVDTLLSGAYIGVDAGTSDENSLNFTGLETPPTVIGGTPGKSFVLHTEDLGSLDIGSPVYYRRIQVGRVASYQLDESGESVTLQIFVDAPYDRYVTTDTRFWNASGVDVSLGADGLKLQTESVATIVAGGIAFAAPPYSHAKPAEAGAEFGLAKDYARAIAPPNGPAQYVQLRFEQPLRGLSVGAPVQFSGVDLGNVVSMGVDFDPARHRFPTVVGVVLYPQRLGQALEKLPMAKGETELPTGRFLGELVQHGLRAQARTGNLLTGQLYIALDFIPNAPKATFDASAQPMVLPTVGGSFDRLQEQLAGIVGKIDKLPFEAIGQKLDATLAELDLAAKKVNGEVLPGVTQTMQAASRTLQQAGQTMEQTGKTLEQAQKTFGTAQGMLADDAPLQQNLQQTLRELQRSARSLRTLTDLLGRHPEALLRGRPADPPPDAAASDVLPAPPESRR